MNLVVPCVMCNEIHASIFCPDPAPSRPEARSLCSAPPLPCGASAVAPARAVGGGVEQSGSLWSPPHVAHCGTQTEGLVPGCGGDQREQSVARERNVCPLDCCDGSGTHRVEFLSGATTQGVRVVACGCASGKDGCAFD